MENINELKDWIKLSIPFQDLEIYVKEFELSRKIYIKGNHIIPGGGNRCLCSELITQLSLQTLIKIASRKGSYFRDEIERSENPNYLQRKIEILLKEFGIKLSHKKMLDFGCGAGASTLIFLRCGATNIIGVEVDEMLLDIARSRLNDFFQDGYQLKRIEYINDKYSMPFADQEFDIVWAQAIMEHVLPDQRKLILKELWRVLKKDGLLIIFGTPNRLWIKEYHTSNLFLVNYLPLDLAIYFARQYSHRISKLQSKKELLSSGFRGCTYWEIIRALPNPVCLNNVFRKKDLYIGIQSWYGDTDSRLRRKMIAIYGLLMKLADPFLGWLNLPQTAFLPSLIIILQKP
jgi:ubiquinone/menaquinone biosynthesis C-methylase UbiE